MNVKSYLSVASEVHDALASGRPVVALESTIITHGMPYPQNLEMARKVEADVRQSGAVPATIAIMDGKFRVGLEGEDLERLAVEGHKAAKASRRDVAFPVSGTVATVKVGLGDTVTAGELLASLDPTSLQNALDQASTTLQQAQQQPAFRVGEDDPPDVGRGCHGAARTAGLPGSTCSRTRRSSSRP